MAELHKHLMVDMTLLKPPTSAEQVNDWLLRVVEKVNMNVFIPPMSKYCYTPGNEGVTGVVVIDTSHCSIHVWDHCEVAYAKADLYSCKDFSAQDFIEMIKEFEPLSYSYMVVDRTSDMRVIEVGSSPISFEAELAARKTA